MVYTSSGFSAFRELFPLVLLRVYQRGDKVAVKCVKRGVKGQ
jgi:hypothetical protein